MGRTSASSSSSSAASGASHRPECTGDVWIIALIPDSWLADEPFFADRAAQRAAYVSYLLSRLAEPRAFVEEALDARAKLV